MRKSFAVSLVCIDTNFRRIFWTVANISHDELYPVFTCDHQFLQCHDTRVHLPSPWPFAFFNVRHLFFSHWLFFSASLIASSLIYTPSSSKSLIAVQLYGEHRFMEKPLTTTRENIRSLLSINYQSTDTLEQCANFGAILCPKKICLQINHTAVICLSVDTIIAARDQSMIAISDSSLESAEKISASGKDSKNSRIRSIGFGILIALLAGFVAKVGSHRSEMLTIFSLLV
jgi:hypothetical protein